MFTYLPPSRYSAMLIVDFAIFIYSCQYALSIPIIVIGEMVTLPKTILPWDQISHVCLQPRVEFLRNFQENPCSPFRGSISFSIICITAVPRSAKYLAPALGTA